MKTFFSKKEIQNLILVGFALSICLTISDIFSQYLYLQKNPDQENLLIFGLLSFLINTGIGSTFAILIALPILVISKINETLSKILQHLLALLILLVSIGLNKYLVESNLKLGSDLYGYSFDEIVMIVNTSTTIEFKTFLPIILIPILYLAIYFILKNKISASKFIGLTQIIALFSFILIDFETSLSYFTKDSISYFFEPENELSEEFISKNEFPLMKSTNTIQDVLGQNLNLNESKPNIVFIVVEGLGRDFMGENAQYQGFTPFLDSLSQKSLYWSNFLSTSGRSFGAVPSIFGSVPFGKKGFAEIEETPSHYSLVTLAKQNNYLTSYFEGGDSNFDGKIKYLNNEGIDRILDINNFGPEYSKTFDNEENTWGYPDSEIFKKTLTLTKKDQKPRFDIVMTISNHEPFRFPNKKEYLIKVDNLLKANQKIKSNDNVVTNFKEVFASLLYTDQSIKDFINEYKNKEEYENTIFVITGDHRLIPVPQRNEISRFHVPLIVFSPMLKQAKEFKGVSSHWDIAPSIAKMLKNKYDINLTEKAPWMGFGLSNDTKFSSKIQMALMKYKGGIKDFVNGKYYLSKNKLHEITDNFDLVEIENSLALDETKKLLNFQLALNKYVIEKNKIIPQNYIPSYSNLIKFNLAEKEEIKRITKEVDQNQLYFKARELAHNKDYKRAILLTNYITNLNPNHFDARTLKGRIFGWNHRFKEAEKELQFVIDRNPTYEDSYAALLDLYWWNGDKDNAFKVSRSALNVFKDNNSLKNEIIKKLQRFEGMSKELITYQLFYEEDLLGFKDYLAKN